jgi:rare lipoprotein A (peptidoglycan hydrolase)
MTFFSARILCSLGCVALLISCGRANNSTAKRDQWSSEKAGKETQSGIVVEATWYDVPAGSLARDRAGKAELTAASDRFSLGALLRVTRVSNHKSVVVRVTDTGLHGTGSEIDVCEEAAEQLGIVRKGVARVRVQALPSGAGAHAMGAPGL